MPFPFVSIIIPTLRDPEVLKKCVDSLLKQDYPRERFEIILVSKKELQLDTLNLVDTVAIKTVHGVEFGHARNAGVEIAQGSFLAFLDDDSIVPPNWISLALSHFRDPNVGVVGGPALPLPDDNFHHRMGGYLFSSPFAVGFASVRYRRLASTRQTGERNLLTANTVVRRAAFDAVNGFDSKQVRSEDSDFYFRVKKKGYDLLYVPDVFVWHRSKPTFFPVIHKVFYYAAGRAVLMMRKPQTIQVAYLIPTSFVLGMLILALLAIVSQEFLYLFLGIVGVYGITNFMHALYIFMRREHSIAGAALIFVTTPLIHTAYGLGILFGVYKYITDGGVKVWG